MGDGLPSTILRNPNMPAPVEDLARDLTSAWYSRKMRAVKGIVCVCAWILVGEGCNQVELPTSNSLDETIRDHSTVQRDPVGRPVAGHLGMPSLDEFNEPG